MGFAKGSRFLNTVMTFVLHLLSHYNSIIEPCARFLLSFLEGLSIDFSSYFILSLIDIYRDTTTHDKLIFPSAITWILHHFSVSYPKSTHFCYVCHRHCYRSTKQGLASTKAATNQDGDSSSFFYSLVFCGWSDSRGHHGIACAHGCSP